MNFAAEELGATRDYNSSRYRFAKPVGSRGRQKDRREASREREVAID
jgi:hypothetical protein